MLVGLFWFSVFSLVYVYLIYPLIMALLALLLNKRVQKNIVLPSVTISIAAYNEERCIKETIENKLNLNYPLEKVEIIVVSDGSDDKTDEIVREYDSANVRLLRQEPRQGKTAALNKAVAMAKGEIIVFSDANSIYSKNALRELIMNLSDDSVGYVTGKMIYVNSDGSIIGDGCSTYMRYENFLRSAESRIGSLVGVNGGIDAIRKNLYEPMRPDQQPDFVLPLKVVEKGYRVVYEPNAIVKENSLNNSSEEYKMRVRVALRALNAVKDMKHLLNPIKYSIFAYQLWSHKVLRYFTFIPLFGLYVVNLILIPEALFYQLFVLVQTIFFSCALAGWYLERHGKRSGIFYIPFYFSLLNIASMHAFCKMLLGMRQVTWIPRGGDG